MPHFRLACVCQQWAAKHVECEACPRLDCLALVHGTSLMTALGCQTLLQIADIAAALILEALAGTTRAFDARLHAERPHCPSIRLCGSTRRSLLSMKSCTRTSKR